MSTDFRPQSDRHAGDDHPIAARHAAFSNLYRAHRIDIARLCASILHDRAEAEDATEEAFARTWRAMLEGRDEAYRYPWVRTVARHYCLDVLRKRKRTQVADSSIIETMTPHTAASDDYLVAGVNAELVRASVARVSECHRSILHLRDRDELSYQEIADRESVTIAVVESRLYRARRAVRREFLALSGPEGVAAGFYLRFRTRWFDTQSTAATLMSSVNDRIAPTGIARVGAVGVAATTAITAIAAFGPIHVLPHRSHAAPPAVVATATAGTTPIHPSPPATTAALVAVDRNAKAARPFGRRSRLHSRRTHHIAVLAAATTPVAPAAAVAPPTTVATDTAPSTTVAPPAPAGTTSGSTTATPTTTAPSSSSGGHSAPVIAARPTDRHAKRDSRRSDSSGSTSYGSDTASAPRVSTASATVAVATAPTTTTAAPRQSGHTGRAGSDESDGRRGDRGNDRGNSGPSSSHGASATPVAAGHAFVESSVAPVTAPTAPVPTSSSPAVPPSGGTPASSSSWSSASDSSSGGSGPHGNGGSGGGGSGGGGGGWGGDESHGGGWSGHGGSR